MIEGKENAQITIENCRHARKLGQCEYTSHRVGWCLGRNGESRRSAPWSPQCEIDSVKRAQMSSWPSGRAKHC